MKLKNKKTGEIKECVVIPVDSNGYPNEYQVFEKGESLAELNEEWCDYEEPKEYWFISDRGEIFHTEDNMSIDEKRKFFGNYFETKEEAEKAVEKLKAFKRLKDKGFRFTGYTHKDRGRLDELEIYCQLGECPENIEEMDDVHLLFGGEE